MDKLGLSLRAPQDLRGEADRVHNTSRVGLFLLVLGILGFASNTYMLTQMQPWQLWLAQGILATFSAASLVAVLLSRRGRLNLGATILIANLIIVVVGYAVLFANIGLPLGLVGMVTLIVIASLILPPRWMTSVTIVGILSAAAAGLFDLVGLPLQLTIPIITTFMYPLTGVALLVLSFLVIRRFPSYPLTSKLTIVLITITLLSVGTIAFLNNRTTSATLASTAGANTKSMANTQAQSVARQVLEQVELLKLLSLNRTLQVRLQVANLSYSGSTSEIMLQLEKLDQQWRKADAANDDTDPLVQGRLLDTLSTELRGFSHEFSGHVEVFVTDQYGALVATTNRTSDYYQADEAWWQAAWNKGTGATYISQPEFDESSGTFGILIAAPIYTQDAGTQPAGILRTTYRITNLLQQVDEARLGKTGRAALLLPEGKKLNATSQAAIAIDAETLAQLRATGQLDYAEFNFDGRPSLVSQAKVASTHPYIQEALDRLEWTIVARQDRDEGLAIVQNQTRNILLLALVIASIVAVSALGISQLLARPIVSLTDAARKVSEGDLAVRARVESYDEIGTLAETFNNMTAQLHDLIGSLETRVEARTAQLRASSDIGRAASTILDPQELLQRTVDLIRERFGFYYAGAFLVDQEQRFAVLRAGTGAAGQQMIASGHKLDVSVGTQSMVGWACVNRQARIALDVGKDAMRFANPLLPDTRSEIALPLQVGGRILGALDVQSVKEAAFDENDVAVLQSMADQIAIALENARLFSEAQASLKENQRLVAQSQASLQEATALYTVGQAISTASDTAAIFQAIVEHGLRSEIEQCTLVLFEQYETELPQNLTVERVWTRDAATPDALGIRAGQRYAFDAFPLREMLTAEPGGQVQPRPSAPNDSSEQALVFVPLLVGTRWLGSLGLGASSQAALAPDTRRFYQALASQAAVAIENRRLIESTRSSLQELDALYRRVTREAWQKAIGSQAALTEYDYAPGGPAAREGATLELPLTLRGEPIGVVELTAAERAAWSEQERLLVEAIVTQAALALDGARLFDETQRLAGRERLINEITARIRATTSVQAILQTAARELAQALNVPHAVARIHPQVEPSPDPGAGIKSGG